METGKPLKTGTITGTIREFYGSGFTIKFSDEPWGTLMIWFKENDDDLYFKLERHSVNVTLEIELINEPHPKLSCGLTRWFLKSIL